MENHHFHMQSIELMIPKSVDDAQIIHQSVFRRKLFLKSFILRNKSKSFKINLDFKTIPFTHTQPYPNEDHPCLMYQIRLLLTNTSNSSSDANLILNQTFSHIKRTEDTTSYWPMLLQRSRGVIAKKITESLKLMGLPILFSDCDIFDHETQIIVYPLFVSSEDIEEFESTNESHFPLSQMLIKPIRLIDYVCDILEFNENHDIVEGICSISNVYLKREIYDIVAHEILRKVLPFNYSHAHGFCKWMKYMEFRVNFKKTKHERENNISKGLGHEAQKRMAFEFLGPPPDLKRTSYDLELMSEWDVKDNTSAEIEE